MAGRSGLALKHGIQVLAGVIDSDYRGNVGALLLNMGEKPFQGMLARLFCALHLLQTSLLLPFFTVAVGDGIAQLLVLKTADIEDVVEKRKLSKSPRADAGFGSTGVTAAAPDDEMTTTEEEESDTETEEESGNETKTTEASGTETSMDEADADSDEDM